MSEERRFRWNSWPFVVFRIAAYVVILGVLWYWKTSSNNSTTAKMETTPATEKTDPSGETVVETTLFFPKVTLYGWSVRPSSEGGQQVDVLLKFDANSEEVEYKELKLRSKGSEENLCIAQCTEGREKVHPGLGTLRFLIPAEQPEFRAGKVFCWVKDLCILDSNQRVTPEHLDKWAGELKSSTAPEQEKKPAAPPPALPPPAALPPRA
jgi:hypothetical protein